ncbi:hypothetical protein [Nocardia gipuzkoensis]
MKVHAVRLLVVGLTALSATALAGPADAAPGENWSGCSFHFFKEPTVQNAAVLVSGFADCRPAPQRFNVSLTLQHRPRGGDWEVRGAESDNQIPDPRLNVAAWAPCVDGLWKAVAHVWVTARDEDFRFTEDTHTTIVKC